MPYKSDAQRRYMHAQHPKIAAEWDSEIRAKKKGKVVKVEKGVHDFARESVGVAIEGTALSNKVPPKVRAKLREKSKASALKAKGKLQAQVSKSKKELAAGLGVAALGGALANQIPPVQDVVRERRRKRSSSKAKIKKILVPPHDDPFFNQRAAQEMFDLVMKMDDDTAEVFCYIVASDLFEETVEKNLGTLQPMVDRFIEKRAEAMKTALVKSALAAPADELESFAKAYEMVEEITKAKNQSHTPQFYGYNWQESDFKRDPRTGRFMVKVKHTMTKPLKDKVAAQAFGDSGSGIKDKKLRAKYQDEYRQVASFLEMVGQTSGTENTDVIYHLKDKADNHFTRLSNDKTPPKALLADKSTTLVAMEAKPTTLTAGGAAFGLAGMMGRDMSPEQISRVTNVLSEKEDEGFRQFASNIQNVGGQEGSSRLFGQLAASGNLAQQMGAPGGKIQMAGKMAEIVGQFGPEAERVIGPSARKTAYRYRGTEKAPEQVLVQTYGRQIQEAKRYGAREEEADERLMASSTRPAFGTQREQLRGDFIPMGTRRGTGARERRAPAGEPMAVGQMGRNEAALAQRAPTWAEQGMGSAIVADYLARKLPDKHLYRLHIQAGNTPPSEGVIINSDGQLAVQAVGYGDDHYVPFNLANLKALKGGEYIRNRSVGGLTSEDVYTGLMAGARRVTVVSRSGTFSMEFEPDFRGGRRHNDKARRMTRRYENILDAVQSGQVDRQNIPLRWRKAIKQEVIDEYPEGTPKQVINEETQERLKEFKEKPEIEGRDEDRAEAMIARMEEQANRGAVTAQQARDYRTQIYNELHNMKEVRFRLNGIGYEAGLKSLQEQFPYYIKDVKTRPTRDEELLEFELDEGYVEPGRNRPSKARAGLFGTPENPSEKYSASQADYQRGRYGTAALNAKKKAEELPATTPEGGATGSAKLSEKEKASLKRKDEFAREHKVESHKKAALSLRNTVKRHKPEFQEGATPPVWWYLGDREFKDWVDKSENADDFFNYMTTHQSEFERAVPGYSEDYVNYKNSRGMLNQVKWQKGLAGHYGPEPYDFSDEDGAAYHAGAKESDITTELLRLDSKHPVMFSSTKRLSAMSDDDREREVRVTQRLRGMAQGGVGADVIVADFKAASPDATDSPPAGRLEALLKDDKSLDKHLEDIHRSRYLIGMKPTAKKPYVPPKHSQPPPEPEGPPTGETGGLPGNGGQPKPQGRLRPAPAQNDPINDVLPNTEHIRALVMGGADRGADEAKRAMQGGGLTPAQVAQLKEDYEKISIFREMVKANRDLDDGPKLQKAMDEELTPAQQRRLKRNFTPVEA